MKKKHTVFGIAISICIIVTLYLFRIIYILNSIDFTNNNKRLSALSADEIECSIPNTNLQYRLSITDSALGKRSYSLIEIKDSKTVFIINEDPFLGSMGTASGITFLDEKLGFIGLSKSGGNYSDLYRTEDGGVTFEKVNIPKVTLEENSLTLEPFDFLNMPYKENGILSMLVGQGMDGDYNGNSSALYQSNDNGVTWEYIKEVKNN